MTTVRRIVGVNQDIPPVTSEPVSLGGDYLRNFGAGSAVRVKAGGNAADTLLGAGAQTVIVTGLSTVDGSYQTSTIDLAGAAASAATAESYKRVLSFEVATNGTPFSANTGAITLETTAPADICTINTLEGNSLFCAYTVPLGKKAIIKTISIGSTTLCIFDFVTTKDSLNETSCISGISDVYTCGGGMNIVKTFVPGAWVLDPLEMIYPIVYNNDGAVVALAWCTIELEEISGDLVFIPEEHQVSI
jgi:hypothetical protein